MKTKLKILKHAKKLYVFEGEIGVSMRRVAREAGIVQSVIYHYYVDKKELIHSLFEYIEEQYDNMITNLLTQESAKDQLASYIDLHCAMHYESSFLVRYYEENTAETNIITNYVSSLIKKGIKTKEFRNTLHIENVSRHIVYLIHGVVLLGNILQVSDDKKHFLQKEVMNILLSKPEKKRFGFL